MINNGSLFNAVLILTVATQRTSTIYFNQSVQSLSAVNCLQQTFQYCTLNTLRLFATAIQQNPAGELASKEFLIENIFNDLGPKMRTHILLATVFYQFERISSLQFFSIILKDTSAPSNYFWWAFSPSELRQWVCARHGRLNISKRDLNLKKK